MADTLKNLAYSTVATAPSPALSGTSLVVQPGDGTKFAVGNAVAWPPSVQPSVANAEIIRITVVAVDTLTITRTQESSTNQSILVGWQIQQGVTAALLAQYMALSTVTTAGDLIVATGAGAVGRLAIGTVGQVLPGAVRAGRRGQSRAVRAGRGPAGGHLLIWFMVFLNIMMVIHMMCFLRERVVRYG